MTRRALREVALMVGFAFAFGFAFAVVEQREALLSFDPEAVEPGAFVAGALVRAVARGASFAGAVLVEQVVTRGWLPDWAVRMVMQRPPPAPFPQVEREER